MYVKGMQKALNGHCIRHNLSMVGKSDARDVGTFTFTLKTNKTVDTVFCVLALQYRTLNLVSYNAYKKFL